MTVKELVALQERFKAVMEEADVMLTYISEWVATKDYVGERWLAMLGAKDVGDAEALRADLLAVCRKYWPEDFDEEVKEDE